LRRERCGSSRLVGQRRTLETNADRLEPLSRAADDVSRFIEVGTPRPFSGVGALH
jgi:hypothetical protein